MFEHPTYYFHRREHYPADSVPKQSAFSTPMLVIKNGELVVQQRR